MGITSGTVTSHFKKELMLTLRQTLVGIVCLFGDLGPNASKEVYQMISSHGEKQWLGLLFAA